MPPHHSSTAPLRIGYVVKRFPKLSETFVMNEIAALERSGVEVEIFSLKAPRSEPQNSEVLRGLNARVHYLDRGVASADTSDLFRAAADDLFLGKTLAATTQIRTMAARAAILASRSGCQHLHAHFANDAALVAVLAAQASGVPMSITAHAKDIYHTYTTYETDRRVRKAKIAAAKFVVTVTEANKDHLVELAGPASATEVVRIYNGIDVSRFPFVDAASRDAHLLLAVGRLVEKKGYGDLLRALVLCRPRIPQIRLVICGDGPLRAQIEAEIDALDLSDCVELMGAVTPDQVRHLMQRAAALVLPSLVTESGDRDALPTVLLEAHASGLPVISTDVSGIPEIVTGECDGLLVPQRDPPALAAAIQRLIGDRRLAQNFAVAGRKNVLKRFNLEKNVVELRQLFSRSVRENNFSWDGDARASASPLLVSR